MPNAALIVAAGRGTRARAGRAGSKVQDLPKQYARIGPDVVLARTIGAFIEHPLISIIQVVIHPDDSGLYAEVAAALAKSFQGVAAERLLPPVPGGESRQQSVWNGLRALEARGKTGEPGFKPQSVLVHDAARPFVTPELISAILGALSHHDGAIAALPVSDTLKRADSDGLIADTVERAGLWRAQTPQGFGFDKLLACHAAARAAGHQQFTDDAAIAEWAGLRVKLVEGSAANVKLTTAEDLAMAARGDKDPGNDGSRDPDLGSGSDFRAGADLRIGPDLRIGNGFDVHRFTTGDHVLLCGVKIPHGQGLEGHSDADVGLHALTDALLGAIADGDIGAHFPPSQLRWKDASSDRFLKDAAARVRALGGRINNVDVTLLCETPKIGPHRNDMRAAVAAILDIDAARVAVKATTTEGLGFTGRGEGIAAMASASVLLPG